MRIEPNLYLVGSGSLGFDLTDPLDCNIYLFDAGGSYILFDIGTGLGVDQILDVCRQDGLDPAKIDHLFLSHAHTDHGGGTAHLRDRIDLTVYASQRTAEIVTAGDAEAVSLPVAQAAGFYPRDYVYRASPVDRTLEAGKVVEIGPYKIELIFTPGHSHDHHCYLVTGDKKRYLVGADAIFYGGRVIWQNTYDCNVPDTLASIKLLASYSFEALLPGHLNFSLNNGKRHIETACDIISKLGCPTSIL
jgi:hydroxyacylglutathione hydrolase